MVKCQVYMYLALMHNKFNPHMTPSLGMEPGPHWWEVSALNTVPSLLPKKSILYLYYDDDDGDCY